MPENFANLITIQGAHTVDLAITLAGAPSDLSARATAQYPEIRVGDTKEARSRSTFDHLLLQSRFATGGVLSVEVAGGRPPETPFRLQTIGETGILRLDGGAMRGFQSGRLTLSLDGVPQRVDEGELAASSDSAAKVAGVYAALRDDIAGGLARAMSTRRPDRISSVRIGEPRHPQAGLMERHRPRMGKRCVSASAARKGHAIGKSDDLLRDEAVMPRPKKDPVAGFGH